MAEILSFCTGQKFGCSVFDDGLLKCWGVKKSFGLSSSASDFLGDSTAEIGNKLPFIDVGSLNVTDVYCGDYHVCVKLSNDAMKCAGENLYGQLGLGLTDEVVGIVNSHIGDDLPQVNLGSVNVTSMALGYYHTCVITTEKKVKCFGRNRYGQLGYENNLIIGDSASEMGDNLQSVDLGTNAEVDIIASGINAESTCVILSAPLANAQKIKCWGYNFYHQLGYGATFGTSNVGDGAGEMGDNLPFVDLGAESKAKAIALGGAHTCALLVNNSLKCWGMNSFGQLGLGSTGLKVSSTGDALAAVSIDNTKVIKFVAAHVYSTCVSYTDNVTLKCFGANSKGQLGQGDVTLRGVSAQTTVPNIPAINLGTSSNIASVHCGRDFTCVIFEDSVIKCFGDNANGQLAIGSTTIIGDGPNEMGNNLKAAKIQTLATSAPVQVPTFSPTPPTLATAQPTSSPSASGCEKINVGNFIVLSFLLAVSFC